MGLLGEVGSVVATAKKVEREKSAYLAFRADAEEEFGDALWYVAALARRLGKDLTSVFVHIGQSAQANQQVMPEDSDTGPIEICGCRALATDKHDVLIQLCRAAARMLDILDDRSLVDAAFDQFVRSYLTALQALQIPFASVVATNLQKVTGRFLPPDLANLPSFDSDYDEDERLPDTFEIVIKQRRSGQTFLQMNGVFLGDPLTDNISEPDGYRFHDVFHLANAAILHWSPVVRALLKRKRKSRKEVDEAQEGGRAIVIEEGLTAWLFSRAKPHFYEGASSVSFDVLKRVKEFVLGYEVERCPLALWESAILQGYEVFRQLSVARCGVVIGSRRARTISFRGL
jgi:hypothetical protein